MELTGLQLYEDNVTVTCLKQVDVNCEDDTFLFFQGEVNEVVEV